MLGHELAVEKSEAAGTKPRDEPGQRHLRCIGRAAEHALPEECAAERDPVDSSNQPAVQPHLQRVGEALGIEGFHRILDGPVDPGLRPVRAAGEDACEIAIAGHREAARAQPLRQRPREVETIQRQDRPLARLDPVKLLRLPAVRHGEDARGIALEEQEGVERRCQKPSVLSLVEGPFFRLCLQERTALRQAVGLRR